MNLPFDVTAEESVLGSILINPKILPEIESILTSECFYRSANATIFEAIKTLDRTDVDIDVVTLRNILVKSSDLDGIGGVTYLMSIAEAVPTSSHAVSYARLVKEAYAKRVCITEAQKAMEKIAKGTDETFAIIEAMVARMESVSRPTQEAVHLDEVLKPTVEEILSRTDGGRGIPTGLFNIDKITHGFRPGEFAIIGARPSMGKSALALQMANSMARSKVPVLYVSIEMSQSMVAQRLLSYATGIDGAHMANGILYDHEKDLVRRAMMNMNSMPFYVSSHSPCNMAMIRSMATRLKRSAGIKAVFVDYLQMIDGGNTDNRTREVGVISRGLKSLAKELDVAVIALSSLSRKVESRDDKRPIMSDLRESGDIESDADLVTFLYRPMYYADQDQKEGLTDEDCEFIVSKNRNGPIGTARLTFFNTKATFDDAADMGAF